MNTIIVASNDAVRDNLVNDIFGPLILETHRLGHDEAELGVVGVRLM